MSANPSSTNRTLADLSAGQAGLVTELHSQGPVRRRMMDLGIVPGTLVSVEMKSPLGDPVAYRVRGAVVALRLEQARLVLITDAPIVEENQ
jgi:ferrous iron transport protein A